MLLKRIYEHDSEGSLVEDPEGNLVLDHIKVLRSGRRQRFSDGLVGGGILEGWIALKGKNLTLLTKPRLRYRIERTPGWYCSHCGEELPGSLEARAHVETEHAGKKSPDPSKPAGYEQIHYYDCVKIERKR